MAHAGIMISTLYVPDRTLEKHRYSPLVSSPSPLHAGLMLPP